MNNNEAIFGLSARELTVLRELAKGHSNKEIGISLNITEATCKLHMKNILKRLGVTNRTSVVIKALQLGIITLETLKDPIKNLESIRVLASTTPRVETGPVQFGDDWPGLFIRGDNAMHYYLHLKQLLDKTEELQLDVFTVAILRGLESDLSSCIERPKGAKNVSKSDNLSRT